MSEQLSVHFARNEFACKCGCGLDNIQPDLIEALELLRGVVNRPVRINSGVRCPAHNRAVGGADASQHLIGRAADIIIEGVPPIAIGWIAKTLGNFSGIKIYRSWVHLDIREGKRFYAGF